VIDQSRQTPLRSDAQPAQPVELRHYLSDRRHNLPYELTPLIGRADAIKELRRQLVDARLLTLTGPGGIGKTRLAVALGHAVLADYVDGVWFVDLASVAEPTLVAPKVAAVLGMHDSDGPLLEHLAEVFRSRATLVVLDNCEHLRRTCAEVSEYLLRACPGLQVVATSRERLNVRGEVVWRVPGLALPDRGSVGRRLPELEQVGAIKLFAERARAISGLELTAQNCPAVATICRQLEGIPLAIELAAGRTNVLTPQEMAGRVGDLVGLLRGGGHTTPARQQTMRATLGWSYGLLSETERRLFDRLSIFAGGWTLEAAAAICVDREPSGPIRADNILELTGRLVDQSLVVGQPNESGDMRYRMLEPVREYALERFTETGLAANLRTEHRDWYLALAELARPGLFGPHQGIWFARLEREHDNLRAALEWSLQEPRNAVSALLIAGALYWFWRRRGHGAEGRVWLARALAHDAHLSTSVDPNLKRARLRALRSAGILACEQGDYEAADKLLADSLALAEALEDTASIAESLYWFGFNGFFLGHREQGRVRMQRCLDLWRQVGDAWGMTFPLAAQVSAALWRGEFERATTLARERLSLAQQTGDPWLIASVYGQLGLVAYHQGQYDQASELLEATQRAFVELDDPVRLANNFTSRGIVARAAGEPFAGLDCFSEGLRAHHRLGQLWGVVDGLEGIASILTDLGRFELAAQLIGTARALRTKLGFLPSSFGADYHDRVAKTVRGALGDARYDALCVKGERLDVDAAVAGTLVMVTRERARGDSTLQRDVDPLTNREREVANLVADGLSNREIAERLVIAVSTAERHIANILAKLALTSRTQLAARVLQHGSASLAPSTGTVPPPSC
jgi:non-specific serine/threonine protein kinase